MCTYNGARFLSEQLESIAAQTRPPDELVVCDDTSNDETFEIARAFSGRVPFAVRLERNEKNLGSTKNFEKAINLCRGEIVALADQDDVWHPEKLVRTEDIFCRRPSVGLVFTDAEVVDEGLARLNIRLWNSERFTRAEQKTLSSGRGLKILLNHNVVTGSTMSFRSNLKGFVLPIPDLWVHDAWIALLVSATAEMAMIPEPLISYRKHPKQQIGPSNLTFAEQLTVARRTGFNEYMTQVNQYTLAIDRLRQFSDELSVRSAESQVRLKVKHLLARARMPRSRVLRVAAVLGEMASFRYRRFSRGWRSAAKDLAV
jgi:glycosyltransferase involved in cell wall biosynthesis